MATKATTAKPVDKPVIKAERKKPVRKSPAQKDFANKLAWLKAMTAYEESAATATNTAKVARLDKRIAAKQKAIDVLAKEILVLQAAKQEADLDEVQNLIDEGKA